MLYWKMVLEEDVRGSLDDLFPPWHKAREARPSVSITMKLNGFYQLMPSPCQDSESISLPAPCVTSIFGRIILYHNNNSD